MLSVGLLQCLRNKGTYSEVKKYIYLVKKISINRNRSKCVFKLMNFPEFAINHESQ